MHSLATAAAAAADDLHWSSSLWSRLPGVLAAQVADRLTPHQLGWLLAAGRKSALRGGGVGDVSSHWCLAPLMVQNTRQAVLSPSEVGCCGNSQLPWRAQGRASLTFCF